MEQGNVGLQEVSAPEEFQRLQDATPGQELRAYEGQAGESVIYFLAGVIAAILLVALSPIWIAWLILIWIAIRLGIIKSRPNYDVPWNRWND
ncbi:hypothetical protein LCGC14_2523930 [marine sediment metagenome]|uniref:Uncharacterized protein n=1 Tax=marine sediment metagenome TaxID=412755 RepID=A0A0F9BIE4_9ZZZZ